MRYKSEIFLCLCSLLFTGCNMPFYASTEATAVPIPTATDTPKTVQEDTPTSVPTDENLELLFLTETPQSNPGQCLILLVPSEGEVYPEDRDIEFVWEALPGAEKYLLEISNSSGWLLSIETVRPQYKVAAQMFPGPALYTWTVLALDSEGTRICRTGSWSFSISVKKTLPTAKPDKDQGGGRDEPADKDQGGGGDDDDFPFPEW